jgi:hypothetical protein
MSLANVMLPDSGIILTVLVICYYNTVKSVYRPLTTEINLPPPGYEIDLPKVIPLLGP